MVRVLQSIPAAIPAGSQERTDLAREPQAGLSRCYAVHSIAQPAHQDREITKVLLAGIDCVLIVTLV